MVATMPMASTREPFFLDVREFAAGRHFAVPADEARTIETQIRLTEIPAPFLKEAARGEEMKRLFQQAGLRNVRADNAGNVLGDRSGAARHPHLVIAAHLDTVFPEGTNIRVRRE